jgi:hypothetical protein
MKKAYRVLAFLIAVEVVVQAAAIAFAVFGLSKWIEDGHQVNKAILESNDTKFTGVIGFTIHGINGQLLIPLLGLILLIISFFAKVPGGSKWAGIIFGLIAVQVVLGFTAHAAPALGPLHGINALAIFSVAFLAGKRVGTTPVAASVTAGDRADV